MATVRHKEFDWISLGEREANGCAVDRDGGGGALDIVDRDDHHGTPLCLGTPLRLSLAAGRDRSKGSGGRRDDGRRGGGGRCAMAAASLSATRRRRPPEHT
ncbi:hypothetical protein E2562_030414 [Oryza meyeriana var. granulata]|uniref:Uncharacterized protein n=1 Tax=Oryza meyeriana var. granulata TaxID=110450 RepID=A0A6G1FDY1_9ORYZ|nr:hypothetical protein E2562_030414 [Oryza meyeriana var. granulata]